MGFFEDISNQYGPITASHFKTWASNTKKLASQKNRRIFLLNCKNKGLLPAHIDNQTRKITDNLQVEDGHMGQIVDNFYHSHFKSAAALLATFMLSSWITTGYIAYSNSHVPGTDDPLALFDKIYDKPWTRLGPYLIGMCCGWYLFKKNCKVRMTKVVLVVGWILSTTILLTLIYGLYETKLAPWLGASYSALSHSAWAIGLAWIVVACVTGYGGVVNKILSATILYPFSRITYCAYLLHPISIRVMVMSMDSPLHLGSIVTIVIYLGQMVLSYVLAFFVSIAFEAPIVSLLRIITKVVIMGKHKNSSSNAS